MWLRNLGFVYRAEMLLDCFWFQKLFLTGKWSSLFLSSGVYGASFQSFLTYNPPKNKEDHSANGGGKKSCQN